MFYCFRNRGNTATPQPTPPRNPFINNNRQQNSFLNDNSPRNPFVSTNVNVGRPVVPTRTRPVVPTRTRPVVPTRTNNRNTQVSNNLQTQRNTNINTGRPLASTNLNNANRSNQRNPNVRFPPLPASPFTVNTGRLPNNRANVNTIVTNNNFKVNRNNNRANIDDRKFNLNNNPFLSRTSTNLGQQKTTTRRPFRPLPPVSLPRVTAQVTNTTPRPLQTRRPTTARPIQTTTVRNARPRITTPAPRRSFSNQNSISSIANPFQTAARLHSAVRKNSTRLSSNPFIAFNAISSNGVPKKKPSSSTKKQKKPRKSLPVRVPDGFEWPGGNGYYFRMSTGNSKPIQYFISYDD